VRSNRVVAVALLVAGVVALLVPSGCDDLLTASPTCETAIQCSSPGLLCPRFTCACADGTAPVAHSTCAPEGCCTSSATACSAACADHGGANATTTGAGPFGDGANLFGDDTTALPRPGSSSGGQSGSGGSGGASGAGGGPSPGGCVPASPPETLFVGAAPKSFAITQASLFVAMADGVHRVALPVASGGAGGAGGIGGASGKAGTGGVGGAAGKAGAAGAGGTGAGTVVWPTVPTTPLIATYGTAYWASQTQLVACSDSGTASPATVVLPAGVTSLAYVSDFYATTADALYSFSPFSSLPPTKERAATGPRELVDSYQGVWWLDGGNPWTLRALPSVGQIVAKGLPDSARLAAAESQVFVSRRETGTIERAVVGAGTTPFVSGEAPVALAGFDIVVWANAKSTGPCGGGAVRGASADGPIVTFDAGGSPTQVAVTETHVYWMDPTAGTVKRGKR
jgi:hypothetical protein